MNTIKINLMDINLQLFFAATNKTTDSGLSDEMKTFYSDYLIDNAEPKLVHDQFGQKHPIPKNGGKQIEFRKYDPLPKLSTPLSEGVTPTGQSLSMDVITATVQQFGGFVELSDMLLLTAIDNNLVMATKLIGSQAGRTLDTITREVLNGGTNVQYADERVSARHLLVGGSATAANNHYMTVDAIRRAVRSLKNMNAETIGDSFVGIIHPDVSYDLMSDPKWVNVKTYSDPSGIYQGEIGKIENVRFVETSEAKIFSAANLLGSTRNLTVKTAISAPTGEVAVKETISAAQATALAGRKILLNGLQYTIASASTSGVLTLALGEMITTAAINDVIYPGEAGAAGRTVYSTLILADNAYGTTEITGGGLQHIVKQLGSAGTSDPLDQRATAGWKATKVAERLVEAFMRRIETAATFESAAN